MNDKNIIEKVLKDRYGNANYNKKNYFIKSDKDGVIYVCKVIVEDMKKALKIKNKLMPKIIKRKFLGEIEYHLKLPKEFELSWAYFHKCFRQIDGENEKEQKLIDNFYKAFKELPDECLGIAEEYLLQLSHK